jgi:protein-tyrosine phosphatase
MIKRWKQWLQGESHEAESHAVPPERRVLMVCMGNICRSPSAEGVLRAKLQRAGLHGRVVVDSAGTTWCPSSPGVPRDDQTLEAVAAGRVA